MVDQSDIPEPVHEQVEEHNVGHGRDARFRRMAAVYLGVVAMLLAISSLGGGKATKEMLNANIHASDAYAFAQAKYLRETAYELAADQLEAEIAAQPALPDAAKASMTASINKYRAAAARYANDPAGGEGRQQLLERAKVWEAVRDRAERQDPNFEFAAALFQIAIVLGSVSIVAMSRALLGFSAILAAVALLLTVNGYFLIVTIPSFG
jgi:predicted secreted protein